MCGIVGVAGRLLAIHDKLFRDLLIVDSLRGEDSTGIATVKCMDGDVRVVKELGGPHELFEHKAYDRAIGRINKVLLGHNRFATSGGISKKTAHPFDFETLVGVHNGTLTNRHLLLDSRHFTVDSENLYHHIEEEGLDSALDVLEGAWALVWWDKLKSELNFLRNKERPMFITRSEDKRTMFWASESWMLSSTLTRLGIKHDKVELIDVDTLYTFDIDGIEEIPKPTVKKAASRVQRVFSKVVDKVKQIDGSHKHDKPSVPPDLSYLNKKDIRFETLTEAKDANGQTYIVCFDPTHSNNTIRWYPRKDCPVKRFLGEDVIGDISGMATYNGVTHYKISPWTVKLATPKEAAVDLYLDHKGKLIQKKEWLEKYPYCQWCSDPMDIENPNNALTTNGDCFCPSCKKLPEVIESVHFIK